MAQCERQPNLFSEDPLRNQIHPGQWNRLKVMFGFLPWPGYASALGSLPDSPGDLPFGSASVSLVSSKNRLLLTRLSVQLIYFRG